MKKIITIILCVTVIISTICISSADNYPIDYFDSFEGSHNDATIYNWTGKEDLLYTLEFSSDTKWPADKYMPHTFKKSDRDRIMEFGKDPGLGIRKLQALGYTGKGVNVAIIDMPLLLDHIEYKDRDIHYYELDEEALKGKGPSSHGSGMASILIGKNVGVVPDSKLHFFANPLWLDDQKSTVDTLKKIMEMNKTLPDSEKIKVVSMSFCAVESLKNHELLQQTIDEARNSGIIVIDVKTIPMAQVTCLPFKDKDVPENYQFARNNSKFDKTNKSLLFVPTGGKTIANSVNTKHYFYQTNSGISSAVPYIAGVIAIGVQVDPTLTYEKAMTYLWESGYNYYKGKMINPEGFIRMVESDCKDSWNAAKDVGYRYFLYNSSKVDSDDMKAIKTYISKFDPRETAVLIDTSGYNSALMLWNMLKDDAKKRNGMPKGLQIFGISEDVPAFDIGFKVKLDDNIDTRGIFKSDHFYSNFNSVDLYDEISIYDVFKKKLQVDFIPEWPVARLLLTKGEYDKYMQKYEKYTKTVSGKALPIVDFSSPVFPQDNHTDDTGALLERMSNEFQLISSNSYKLYGNLQGIYPVDTKVLGDFSQDNLMNENAEGVCNFTINGHGQQNNIDKYIVDKNSILKKYENKTLIKYLGKSVSEFRQSLLNTSNINTILCKNYYNLFSRSCLNAYGLNENNIIHEAMAKGNLISAIANTYINSNNGMNVNANWDALMKNNPAYNYMLYAYSMLSGNSMSYSFYAAKSAYVQKALIHNSLNDDYGNYQYQLHNALSQSFLGLLEYNENRQVFMQDFLTKIQIGSDKQDIDIDINSDIDKSDSSDDSVQTCNSSEEYYNNRIIFKDNGYQYTPITTDSKFKDPRFKLLELSAAKDKDNVYFKVKYVSPVTCYVILYLSEGADGLCERHQNMTRSGTNMLIIRFGKEELKQYKTMICINVGDEHSIVLDKSITDKLSETLSN